MQHLSQPNQIHFVFLFLCIFFTTSVAAKTQIYGNYNRGCIIEAEKLPEFGTGYQSVRRNRHTSYGHASTLETIADLGKKIAATEKGMLIIGNLSTQNGGPLYDHSISHQNGLDFDVAYQIVQKPLSAKASETFEFASILHADHTNINPEKWNDTIAHILKTTAELPQVERILVHPLIKKQLCTTEQEKTWLKKIRPWFKHDNHFHVRLKCPEDSPKCVAQDPPPDEIGCSGEAFAWWFSEEAKLMEAGKLKKPIGKSPTLAYPEECK